VLAKGMNLLDREPGFVSTTVHKSTDGNEVISYVQWDSRDSFESMRGRADAQDHFASVGRLVTSVTSIACTATQVHNREASN
jgi:heme-degrading monooxygenase HmoA